MNCQVFETFEAFKTIVARKQSRVRLSTAFFVDGYLSPTSLALCEWPYVSRFLLGVCQGVAMGSCRYDT